MSDWLDRPLAGAVGDCTPGAPGLLVEVWLAVPARDGWRVLMLRRSAVRGGFWQGVSGRVESTDATLRDAALRELEEELGLHGGVELLDLGRWYTFESVFSSRVYRKRSLGAILPPLGARDVTLSDEHVEARVVSFDEARALVRWPENATELRALEALLGARGQAVNPGPCGRA